MPRIQRCLLGLGLVWLGFLVPAFSADPPGRRPNIVFIYTDDQARWSINAYGNPEVKTPSFDRIAREGALFRNAFTVTPVCSPSRAGMFTSRYPTTLGIDDYINPKTEPDLGLDPSALGWPEILRGAGYSTMLLGKWHLGNRDHFHPTRQGYDEFFGFLDGANTPMNPTLEVHGKIQKLQGAMPDLLVDEGLRFIEAHRHRPFLLSVHFRAPHVPYAPVPEVDSAVYRDLKPAVPEFPGLDPERVRKLTRDYYASVHSVDRNVGRLLDALDRWKLERNTIVMSTSDHGYMIGHHGLWHKGNAVWLLEGQRNRHRPNMFDDAIRVPLLIRYPGVIAPGTVVDQVVSNLDIFPSVLDLTGVGTPPNLAISGRSVVPLLRPSNGTITWDDTLFGQYNMHHGQVARMRMIRTPDWKLVRHFEPGVSDELYDLKADPGETVNLIDAPAQNEALARLRKMLEERMASVGDPLASRSTPRANSSVGVR